MAQPNQNPNAQNITQRLEGINFPASKQDIMNKVGNEQVNVQGRNLSMRDIVQRLPKDRYKDKNEVQQDLTTMPEFRT